MKKYGIIAIVGLVGIGVFLYYHFKKQVELLMQYTYKVKGYEILKMTFKEIALRITLAFENKSDIDFTIVGYDIEIFANGKSVGFARSGRMNEYVAPRGSSDITITVAFDPKTTIKNAITLDNIIGATINRDQIKLRFKGYFSISHKGFLNIKDFPIDMEYALSEFYPS